MTVRGLTRKTAPVLSALDAVNRPLSILGPLGRALIGAAGDTILWLRKSAWEMVAVLSVCRP